MPSITSAWSNIPTFLAPASINTIDERFWLVIDLGTRVWMTSATTYVLVETTKTADTRFNIWEGISIVNRFESHLKPKSWSMRTKRWQQQTCHWVLSWYPRRELLRSTATKEVFWIDGLDTVWQGRQPSLPFPAQLPRHKCSIFKNVTSSSFLFSAKKKDKIDTYVIIVLHRAVRHDANELNQFMSH